MNSKLHAVCDGEGRPIVVLLSEGQMRDHKGASLVVDALRRPKPSSPTAAVTAPPSARRWRLGADWTVTQVQSILEQVSGK